MQCCIRFFYDIFYFVFFSGHVNTKIKVKYRQVCKTPYKRAGIRTVVPPPTRERLPPRGGWDLGQGQGQFQGWGTTNCPRGKLPPGQGQGFAQGQFGGWRQFSSGAIVLEPKQHNKEQSLNIFNCNSFKTKINDYFSEYNETTASKGRVEEIC